MAYYRCNKLDGVSSGAIANFTTSLELPIKSLEVDVNAVQENGTPTPQSPKAITGVSAVNVTQCGKNLFDVNNITLLEVASGSRWGYSISKAGTYKASVSYDGSAFLYCVIKAADGTFGSSIYLQVDTTITPRKITVNEGETLIFYNASANQTEALTKQKMSNAQIEVGTTTTEHEPYNGITEVIELGGTYYGGHFTQDKAGHRQFDDIYSSLVNLPDLSFSATTKGGHVCFYADLPNGVIKSGGEQSYTGKCSTYSVTSNLSLPNDMSCVFYCSELYGGYTRILIRDDSASTMTGAQFKAYVTGQICYEKANSQTIALPDGEPIITLNGTNNIYADTGDTSAQFIKAYLGKICS